MELGKVAKCVMREKRVNRNWQLDKFDDEEVKRRYQNALKSEVGECVSRMYHAGSTGMELVN